MCVTVLLSPQVLLVFFAWIYLCIYGHASMPRHINVGACFTLLGTELSTIGSIRSFSQIVNPDRSIRSITHTHVHMCEHNIYK